MAERRELLTMNHENLDFLLLRRAVLLGRHSAIRC